MIAWLLVAIFLLIGLLALACHRIEKTQQEVRDAYVENTRLREDSHADCLGLVTFYAGGQWAAAVLRDAAKKWDSPAEVDHLHALGRDRYKAGGPSMPNIWLNDLADQYENGDPA